MAVFFGNYGKVVVGSNVVANVTNWSLTVDSAEINQSSMGNIWEQYTKGMQSWNGSIDANWDLTDTGQKALFDALIGSTFVTLYLYVDATRNFSGQAILTSSATTVPYDALETITFDFRGTGALTRNF